MQIEIRDDVIWAKQLRGDERLYDAILELTEGETIQLNVDGDIGSWRKMKTGRDGRPTQGIRPIGAMAEIWKRLQSRRGERVDVELHGDEDADDYLRFADQTFVEWYSEADEEAFRDLQPL